MILTIFLMIMLLVHLWWLLSDDTAKPSSLGFSWPSPSTSSHPLLKTTLTGLRRTYLGFLVFCPKLGETKRFPPILDHMNGNFFLGGSRFLSGKIGLKLAVGGSRPHTNSQELYWKLIVLAQKTALFRITWPNIIFVGQIIVPRSQIFESRCQKLVKDAPNTVSFLILTDLTNGDNFWSRPPTSLSKVTFGIYRSMPIILRGIHFKTKYKYLQEPGTRKRKLKITCACAEYHDFRESKASVRHQMNIVPVFMSNNVYTGIIKLVWWCLWQIWSLAH